MRSIEAPGPIGLFYRIARPPDPLAYPPREFVGRERYDDPRGEYRVLYAADRLETCFVELLAGFRPTIGALARIRVVAHDDPASATPTPGGVDARWCGERLAGAFAISAAQRILDLRAAETRAALRVELAPTLHALRLEDFDLGDALGRRRDASQAVSRWAYEHGYLGIVYPSRFDARFRCWAFFEGVRIDPLDVWAVSRADPSFLSALAFHGLTLIEDA